MILIGGWTIVQVLIAVIIIAAVIGIVYVALQQFGVAIPDWAKKVFWIVVVAVVCIFAIKVLINLV